MWFGYGSYVHKMKPIGYIFINSQCVIFLDDYNVL